jgi:hypothetical protein
MFLSVCGGHLIPYPRQHFWLNRRGILHIRFPKMRNLTFPSQTKLQLLKYYQIFTPDKGLEQCNSGNSGPMLSSHLMLGPHSWSLHKQNAQIGEVSHFAASHCLDMVVHHIRWCRPLVQPSSCCMHVCNVSWEFNSAITATEYKDHTIMVMRRSCPQASPPAPPLFRRVYYIRHTFY